MKKNFQMPKNGMILGLFLLLTSSAQAKLQDQIGVCYGDSNHEVQAIISKTDVPGNIHVEMSHVPVLHSVSRTIKQTRDATRFEVGEGIGKFTIQLDRKSGPLCDSYRISVRSKFINFGMTCEMDGDFADPNLAVQTAPRTQTDDSVRESKETSSPGKAPTLHLVNVDGVVPVR